VKRPAGVVISVVLLVMASLLQLLFACLMVFSAVMAPSLAHAGTAGPSSPVAQYPYLSFTMYAMSAFFLALSVWGILTAVGLFRARRWARYSVLVIATGLAFISFVSIFTSILIAFIPLPQPAGLDPTQAHSSQMIARFLFASMAVFYTGLLAVAVWWLVYFNRQPVRELFAAGAPVASVPCRRPLPISILAALQLFGAVACLLGALLPLPAFMFGWTFHGTGKAVVYAGLCGLDVLTFMGLWRLREWGRRLTFFMLGFTVLNLAANFVRPSSFRQYQAEVHQMMSPSQPQLPAGFQDAMFAGSMIFGFILCIVIAAILVRYRAAFATPASTPQVTT